MVLDGSDAFVLNLTTMLEMRTWFFFFFPLALERDLSLFYLLIALGQFLFFFTFFFFSFFDSSFEILKFKYEEGLLRKTKLVLIFQNC